MDLAKSFGGNAFPQRLSPRHLLIAVALCRANGTTTRFIEAGHVPGDAERVGTTWKYVNKGGGPDRRYKNNPRLPIMRYGELTLTAQPGFSFTWQTSQATSAPALTAALGAISSPPRHDGITARHFPPASSQSPGMRGRTTRPGE